MDSLQVEAGHGQKELTAGCHSWSCERDLEQFSAFVSGAFQFCADQVADGCRWSSHHECHRMLHEHVYLSETGEKAHWSAFRHKHAFIHIILHQPMQQTCAKPQHQWTLLGLVKKSTTRPTNLAGGV